MGNISDYLAWRGDLTFEERPFNDADNIVLSALSYLYLEGIVPSEKDGGGIVLRDAFLQLLYASDGELKPYVRSLATINAEYVIGMCQSPRFCNAILSSYVDIVDDSKPLQFSAIQIDLPHAGTYVSYRGTDNNISGWREDFNTSFTITEAQREAARYLQRTIQRTKQEGGPIRVGGHSKGGNLAAYAVLHCPKEHLGRIAQVYSNDGPGMAPEVVEEGVTEEAFSLIKHIVPTYSIVGMLFSQENEPRTIVTSSVKGVGQHDLTTWNLMREGTVQSPTIADDCLALNKVISDWTASLSLEDRKLVVTDIFDALEASGTTKLDEVLSSSDSLNRVIAALNNMDERSREVTKALISCFLDSSITGVSKAARRALDHLRVSD